MHVNALEEIYKGNLDLAILEPLKNFLSKFNIEDQIKDQLEIAYFASESKDENCAKEYFDKYYPHGDLNHNQHWNYNQNDLNEIEKIQEQVVDLKTLAESFNKCKNPIPILLAKRICAGFLDLENKTITVSHFKDLNPIWKPTQEKEYKKIVDKSDKYIGKFVQTTHKHKLGSGFIGVVVFDESSISTAIGGKLNPLTAHISLYKRYSIRWVNWTLQKREIEAVSESDIKNMLDAEIIIEANPDEKQKLNRPSEPQLAWAEKAKSRNDFKYYENLYNKNKKLKLG